MSKLDLFQQETLLKEVAKIKRQLKEKDTRLFPNHMPNEAMLADVDMDDWLQVFAEDSIILGRCHPTKMR
jgi:hypothetical protein